MNNTNIISMFEINVYIVNIKYAIARFPIFSLMSLCPCFEVILYSLNPILSAPSPCTVHYVQIHLAQFCVFNP